MTGAIEVHVDRIVLHGGGDAAAVERSIVDEVTRALASRGLDPALLDARGGARLQARSADASPASVAGSIARSLAGGSSR